MQLLLSGFVLGFAFAIMLFDDLAERKLRKYILEEKEKKMIYNFKIYDKAKKEMKNMSLKENKEEIIIQSTGVIDKKKSEVYDGDYILYETEHIRDFMKVQKGKVEFAFYRWNKDKQKWRKSTYQGIESYGTIIGNKFEGIKSKRLYNEMQEIGINI